MNRISPVIEAHRFEPRDFVGGDPALDFINTVTGRDVEPRDWLDSYARLLEWAEGAELLPAKMLRRLARKAEAEPAAAEAALARARALREALFVLVAAIADDRAPPKQSLALLRQGWVAGVEAHELRYDDGRIAAALDDHAADLDLIAAMVAWRLVEFVLPLPAERLRICAGPNCSWLFADRSKAGRRRWCDMAVCGNAAKSRRFHERSRRR
ncbi:MAG: CGNR zinc finger domain-containing protein [Steroidobacteraceae bacterium]